VSKKIGRGKYSEVFEGVSIINHKKVIIKVLKPGKNLILFNLVFVSENLINNLT
jgi:casein kinase II subunit alpha